MKEILKLKPLLSIRVGFLQLRRSIYIKRVKSVARNESELNAEFGACNHFYKSRTWKGWESWRLRRVEGFASCWWDQKETWSCFIAPPSVSKATGLFTDEGLLKCQGGWRPQIASIILRSAFCLPGTTFEKSKIHPILHWPPQKSKREGWVFLKSSFLVAPHKLYRGEAGLKAIHLGHRELSPLLSILRLALRHSKWKAWNVMPLFKQPGMQSCKKNIQSRSAQYRNYVAVRFLEDMQYVQQIAW